MIFLAPCYTSFTSVKLGKTDSKRSDYVTPKTKGITTLSTPPKKKKTPQNKKQRSQNKIIEPHRPIKLININFDMSQTSYSGCSSILNIKTSLSDGVYFTLMVQ